MNTKQNFRTDLIALSHPLVLASILILLINDHVLKIYAPSVLTGKISDFAGLFFFPILLSAILNLIFQRLNLQPHQVAFASFSFTAIWFTFIKTIPFFTDLTKSALSVQIIRDPSDLMAIVMLLPAWKLRTSIESHKEVKVRKLSYSILLLALLATIATSPPYHLTINNITVYENTVYADEYEEVFYSENGGKTWEWVDFELPSQITEQAQEYPKLPFTLCLPETPDICYQTGEESILESHDGGNTWFISWSIPEGREKYLSRISAYNNLGPFDIAYLELDGKQILIAAAGTEGVLVKVDDGSWESIGVGSAGPMHFTAQNFEEARNNVDTEFYVFCITAFVFLYINILVNAKKRNTVMFRLFIALPLFSIAALIGVLTSNFLFNLIILLLLVFVLMIIFLILEELAMNTNQQAKINLIIIGILELASYSIFILWAYGTIPVYETARWIVVGLHIFLLLWIIYQPIFKQNETMPE